MKKKLSLLSLFFVLAIGAFAAEVTLEEARKVAKNLFFEKTGVKQTEIAFIEEVVPMYYVFNSTTGKGFVLVAGDDLIQPIIGYSTTNTFVTENQPANLKYWLSNYTLLIDFLRDKKAEQTEEIKLMWKKYTADMNNFAATKNAKGVLPLVNHIRWNQGSPWNMFCPADSDPAAPGGHAYAGCVATAMSIVMKYYNYPNQGESSSSYSSLNYGTLSANYGQTNYFFGYMDDLTANEYSALLMYHAGIAVEMNYAANGSSAYSEDVPNVMYKYFRYKMATYKSKNASTTTWYGYLKTEFDAARPVYYSGRDASNGGHAFVCDGYDETVANNYFSFNFGWGGSGNGFYYIDGVNQDFEFYRSQACIIGIIPANIPKEPVKNFIADLSDEKLYDVKLSWELPATKDLVGYRIYRDDELISDDLSIETTSFTDEAVAVGLHYYGIVAVYSDGESITLGNKVEVKDKFIISFDLRQPNGQIIYPGKVTFNGVTKSVNFSGIAKFTDVEFNPNQTYSAIEVNNNYDYPAIEGTMKVYKDQTIVINFIANDINDLNQNISIYPNPSKDKFNIVTDAKILKIEVCNIAGQLITNSFINNQIDLASHPTGMYFVTIITENGTFIEKILRN